MKKGMLVSFVVAMAWLAPLMTLDNAIAYESITANEALDRWLTDETVVLLDVRTLEELYWVGSPAQYDEDGNLVPISFVIPWFFRTIDHNGAVTTEPNEDFLEIVQQNFPDLNQKIIIFCRSGGRSGLAAEELEVNGYTNISEIDTEDGGVGGFQGGKDEIGYRGYPSRIKPKKYQVSWMDSGLPITQSINQELILGLLP